MLKAGYLNSSSSDRYKGVFFKITFYKFPNGWITDLEIEGLPTVEDSDSLWSTRDEAKTETVRLAHDLIDKHQMRSAQS